MNTYLVDLSKALLYVSHFKHFNVKSCANLQRVLQEKNKVPMNCLFTGGRIDHGHHGTYGRRALEETVMFDKAVSSAIDMTSERETLIVVTADHSHVFAMGGYPARGNDILGIKSR